MKRFIYALVILIIILISCKLQDTPVSPPGQGTSVLDSLLVTSPKAGDTLNVASSFNVTWTSNVTQALSLDYSTDNSKTWTSIAKNIANTGAYLWSPIPDAQSNQCRLRITTADSSLVAVSSGFFSISNKTSNSINVTQPNGGESWVGNSSQIIKWVSTGVTKINIEYTINNGVSWTVIDTNIASTGFYNWDPLPNTPSTNARIKIINADDNSVFDESDNVFTIEPEYAIIISSPNGGESWQTGSSHYIRWKTNLGGGTNASWSGLQIEPEVGGTKKNVKKLKIQNNNSIKSQKSSKHNFNLTGIKNVKIEYSINNGADWKSIAPSVVNNGVYLWQSIPNENSSLCIVRVSDANDGIPFDISDNSFTISSSLPQEIVVTKPNGGEVWEAGTTQDITWESTNVSAVNIEYTVNNGVTWTNLVNNIPSTGFYSWSQIPNTASTNCKIRIRDASDTTKYDESNSTFTIAPEPEITVTSPNGGETWQAGTSNNITWTSTNIANVKIEYTINGGADWFTVIGSTPSNGTFNWNGVPDIYSQQCRIKISDADDGTPADISDNNFTITNQIVQSLSIVSPNGGESWRAGSLHNILWQSSAIPIVKLEYTTDNGNSWNILDTNYVNLGAFEWSIPNSINSTQTKVKISDASDGDPSVVSNGVFTISPLPSIRVTSPKGGDVYHAGDEITISWESSGVENVGIKYTYTNGIPGPLNNPPAFFTVNNKMPNTGSFKTSFSIPSSEYYVVVFDAATESGIQNRSTGNFTVLPQVTKSITVLTPNGGESWLAGETHEIQWTSEGVENVNLAYSLDGGASWTVIDSTLASYGTYPWHLPSNIAASDNCLLRISSSSDPTIVDVSNSVFSIMQSQFVRVVAPNGGEQWDYTSGQTIQWTTSPSVDSVDVYYSLDNGANWIVEIKDYPSYGAYAWNPPDVVSSLLRVKVQVSGNPSIFDVSDAPASLVSPVPPGPFITLIAPSQDTTWTIGEQDSIKWFTHRDIVKVDILLSTDNGATWSTIVSGDTETPWDQESNYLWNVTGPATDVARIKIVGYDGTGAKLVEVLSEPFNIVP